MDALATRLLATVDAAYRTFARYGPLRHLTLCLCNCCATPEDRQKLINTPLRQIPSALLAEYTNSAHGVPPDTDELKYFLPRYFELISDDDSPDHGPSAHVLQRLGDMIRADPMALDPQERQVCADWMAAYIQCLIRSEGSGEDRVDCLTSCFETMFAAGFSADLVMAAYLSGFRQPGYGPKAAGAFAQGLMTSHVNYGRPLDLYALTSAAQSEKDQLVALLTGQDWADLWQSLLTDAPVNGLDETERIMIRALAALSPEVWAANLMRHN